MTFLYYLDCNTLYYRSLPTVQKLFRLSFRPPSRNPEFESILDPASLRRQACLPAGRALAGKQVRDDRQKNLPRMFVITYWLITIGYPLNSSQICPQIL